MDLLFGEKCIIFVLAKRREPINKGFSPLFSYENGRKNHCFTKHIGKFICRSGFSTGFCGFFSGQVGAHIDDIEIRKVKRYLFSTLHFLQFRVTTQVTFHWKRNVPHVARGRVTQRKENTLYIIGHQLTLVLARKTKTGKTPCAWCKMALTSHWYCDWLRIPRASSGIFSQSQHHPIGFCIKHKAINRKNNCSAGNITEYSVRRMDNSILFAAVRLVQSWKG